MITWPYPLDLKYMKSILLYLKVHDMLLYTIHIILCIETRYFKWAPYGLYGVYMESILSIWTLSQVHIDNMNFIWSPHTITNQEVQNLSNIFITQQWCNMNLSALQQWKNSSFSGDSNFFQGRMCPQSSTRRMPVRRVKIL